jgi:hypothetical protein
VPSLPGTPLKKGETNDEEARGQRTDHETISPLMRMHSTQGVQSAISIIDKNKTFLSQQFLGKTPPSSFHPASILPTACSNEHPQVPQTKNKPKRPTKKGPRRKARTQKSIQRIPHNAYKTAIMRCPSVFEKPETEDSRPQISCYSLIARS